VTAERERTYIAWRNGRSTALEHGRRPSTSVLTTSEYVGQSVGLAQDVDIVSLETAAGRPSGPRYGTLVHAALATVPLDADAATIATIVQTHGRMVAASTDEMASAADVVVAVLAHPLLAEARAASLAGQCLREVPVTATIGDVLVEGVVDFAYQVGETWVVIDFKTDRAEGEQLERYRRQVSFYASAIAQASGRSARAVLMKV
jgi:ATP-dependent exoDNAse (exonuclease V) beta subunit